MRTAYLWSYRVASAVSIADFWHHGAARATRKGIINQCTNPANHDLCRLTEKQCEMAMAGQTVIIKAVQLGFECVYEHRIDKIEWCFVHEKEEE